MRMNEQTSEELKFLRDLGSHSELRGIPMAKLLNGYLEGSRKRVDWDGINYVKVIKFAEQQLRSM